MHKCSSQSQPVTTTISPVLLFALALAIQADVADARGGGGGGRGSSSKSSGSKSSGSKSSSTKSGGGGVVGAPIIVHSGSSRKCYDKDGKQIPCPSNDKAAIIAGSVIGGVVGLSLIAFLVYWFLKRRKRRLASEPEAFKPTPQSRKNTKEKDYVPLPDPAPV